MAEEFSFAAPFASFPAQKIRSRREVEEELERPCFRFKRPSALEDDLAFFIGKQLRSVDPLGDAQLFLGDGVPLNWATLARYLHDTGIVQERTFIRRIQRHDRPKLHSFGFSLNKTSGPVGGRAKRYSGFGASFDAEEALSKTVGETLERYFLSLYLPEKLPLDSYQALKSRGERVLPLEDLPSFLDWQRELFPQFAWTQESSLRWIAGESLLSGERAWLPAQLVFWNYNHGKKDADEVLLARSTTSGCAGHFSKDEAILSALLELIQRDAFLVFWMNQLSPPVLEVSDIRSPRVQHLLEYVERYGLHMTFLNTTSDIPIPTVTCVIHDALSPDAPVISIGSSTGFSVEEALLQSAIEALLVNTYVNSLPPYILPSDYRPFCDRGLGRAERLSLWKGPQMAERFAFFTAGKTQSLSELEQLAKKGGKTHEERLQYVKNVLRAKGPEYEPYIYEVKHPVLATLGYHVVRAIVPALIPIHLIEDAPLLGAHRLKEVPTILGYKPAPEPNSWPHPFP